ncbi:DUF58 domain-containing protein [Tessaracoccus caeni]|uniref:DUF58 domain-containing protein n=1 Tax=Tessaracoccus caeni TaxID=3031239 RepID=UPI0023DA2FB4|nr:DUF58 domain-containing protein [Tessaracoccus caeni]MDF1487914.1 DUF58 domain-containing protein [Tessaracoccus caeni]
MPLLSLRGLVVLIMGIVAGGAGSLLGEPDLLRLGVFLTLLPLAALLYLLLARPEISVERVPKPAQSTIGSDVEVVLRLHNAKPFATGSLEFTDLAPTAIGGGAQFRVARAFGSWTQAVSYQITTTQRGRFPIGPLKVRFTDPLGLARCTRSTRGALTNLRVSPRVWPLDALPRTAGTGASQQSSPSRLGQSGQDDVLVREHRHGDDMRRVHWRMSAKQGELMVRIAEDPWDPSCTLLVDCRSFSHAGVGPDSSMEWAISATTSIAAKLLASRWRLTVLGGASSFFDPSQQLSGLGAKEPMLEAMTELEASQDTALSALIDDLDSVGGATLVATLGLISTRDAATLIALSTRALRGFAMVPDAAAWEFSGERLDEHVDATRMLVAAGWALATYRPGEPVPDVWRRLVGQGGHR